MSNQQNDIWNENIKEMQEEAEDIIKEKKEKQSFDITNYANKLLEVCGIIQSKSTDNDCVFCGNPLVDDYNYCTTCKDFDGKNE